MNRPEETTFSVDFDSCYVYILATAGKAYTIRLAGNPKIGPSVKGPSCEAPSNDNREISLVYYRHFSDTLSALGFKIALEMLSPASVERIICRLNPTKQDLSDRFKKQINNYLNKI